jgi:DNA-binding NarL/FixJ family response regulator
MKKILVVDDDDLERTALKEILKAEPDWQVTEAADGQHALDLLCDGLRPHLSLFDLRMPKIGGMELLQRVRRDPTLKHLHVAITSATRDRDTVIALSRLGISGYLLKPHVGDKVLATLRQIFAALPVTADPVIVTRNLLHKTVLVVEDDLMERTALAAIIKQEPGWEIIEATSGINALEQLRDGLRPDLCLFDLRMPHMDGLSLLEQIRGDVALQKLRVAILSGEQDRGKILSLSKLGISDYLLKPANPAKLLAALRAAAGLPTASASTPPAATPTTTPAVPSPAAANPPAATAS